MYKPLIIFNNSLKPRPGLSSLKKEGWDIYNILSNYDPVTLKAFAEEAARVGSDKLGVIVENINDPIIEDIYESVGKTKVEIIDIDRLYEDNGTAQPVTSAPSTSIAQNDAKKSNASVDQNQIVGTSFQGEEIIPATKNHISFCFVIHMQQYTNLEKVKNIFNALGKKTASNGILDQIQRENYNVDYNKGNIGPIVGAIGTKQYVGRGKDRISFLVRANVKQILSTEVIDANTRRETSLIDPTILSIQQSAYMAQGLSNEAYIDMVNAYCGAGTIAGVTSGNNSLISDLILDSSNTFSISGNPINKVSRKREAFITFIYFYDPTSILHVNYTPETAAEERVYYFNKNTKAEALRPIANYIENVCKAHNLVIDPEATIKANNERVKQIVLKIKEEIAAGHKVHAYFDPTKSIEATAIWNAAGVFATKCIWLNNIGYGSKRSISDEEAADAADEAERQKKIDKLKAKNAKSSSLVHDWAQAWGQFSDGYQSLADLTANNGTGKGKYDDAIAEEEYYAQLAQSTYGKTKIDNKLTMSFVCAPSFDDFATILFPSWPKIKASGVYSDVDPVRKNGQEIRQGKKQPDIKNQNSNIDQQNLAQNNKDNTKNSQGKSTDDNQKNVKVDPEYSKDSLFPTKAKEDDRSLF